MTRQELLALNSRRMNIWDDYQKAKNILHDNIRWIDKKGGSRQRGEGKKLIVRILARLNLKMSQVFSENV